MHVCLNINKSNKAAQLLFFVSFSGCVGHKTDRIIHSLSILLSYQVMVDQEEFNKLGGHWNMSESYQFNSATLIVSVVFSLIFLLGTIGNSLVLAVLLRNGQMGHNTTNLFILNLSVADFFFIIFCVPFQATIYSLEGWVFGSFMCKAVHFFINLTMYASSFTLAAVSVDRYLAIRYPLRSRELRTPFNAMAAMATIWGLSLVFAGPYLSYYDLVDFASGNVCVPGWQEYDRKVLDTCTFVFGYVIPVLIVSLSYTRTIKYLWTAVDPLDGLSDSKRAKRKVTKMIIIVTVLFCICWLPYHVVILCYLYGDFPFNQTTYAFRLLSHCMAYANSCLNPIVYALVSKHFRKGFKKVFSCILSKKGRNRVHVVHVANTVPGFEAASTEVSQTNEENAQPNSSVAGTHPSACPQGAIEADTLPFRRNS
ncbi:galanin receptor type 2-like [Arapaima gigas]